MKVLVIVAGGLHLGYVGCYGNEWVATPSLDGLAAEGVVFDQHFADRPDDTGAFHAWWTGRYHFSPTEGNEPSQPEPSAFLLPLLRARGVTTALVIDPARSALATAAAAWDHVELVPVDWEGTPLERTLDGVSNALNRLEGVENWLLWVDLPGLRPPWDVPEEFRTHYFEQERDEDEEPLEPWPDPPTGPLGPEPDTDLERLHYTYAAAVTYLDTGLGFLVDDLRQRDLLEEMLLLVTTDRGLALGEHGIIGEYRPWLHDELIHLPLIVRLPNAAEAGRRVFALTQPIDLPPTLLEFFGLPVPENVHGRGLLPLLRGETEQVRPCACSGLRLGEAVEWALRTPEWGFLLPVRPESDPPRAPQLYVKPDDRWEVNNVLQHHLELAGHLEQVLRGFVEATRRPGPLQPPELPDVETELAAQEPDASEEGKES